MAKRAANGRTAGACRASQLSLPRPFPIGERLERAGQLVVRSRIFYDIWFFFESAEARPVIIEVMRRFNEFFRFDPHAHFVAFVVHTAALFEKRRDTINLPSLLKEMKTANLISAQDAAEVDALLAQAKDVASKVTILRSNLFAHRSATLSYDDAFKKANVTANQLRELTEIALKVANRLLLVRGLRDQFFNTLPQENAEAMLTALKESEQQGLGRDQ
jgi:hypothetical protein